MKKVVIAGVLLGTGVLAFTIAQNPDAVNGALAKFKGNAKCATENVVATVKPKTATEEAKENMILAQAELAETKRNIKIAAMNVTQIEKRQSKLTGWLIKTEEEKSAEESLKALRSTLILQRVAIEDSKTVYDWDKDVNADIHSKDMSADSRAKAIKALKRNDGAYQKIQNKKDQNNYTL